MAYKKTYRKRFHKKGNTTVSKAVQKYVKRQITKDIELKFHDDADNISYDTTYTFDDVTAVPQGVGDFQRIGSQINPKWLTVDFIFTYAPGDITNVFRFIVFQWLMDNTSDAPSQAEMFANITAGYNLVSPSTNYDKQRYHMLYDKVILMSYDKPQVHIKKTFRRLRPINFQDSVTTGQNHIYYGVVSDSGAVAHPLAIHYTRLMFSDA